MHFTISLASRIICRIDVVSIQGTGRGGRLAPRSFLIIKRKIQ